MNEYNINVDFSKGKISTNLRKLVQNDYNTTKLNFTFDKEGRVLFKMKYPDGTQYVDEIQNNILVFGRGILNQEGSYEYEISLYSEDGRLTDYATKSFEVRSELVNTDEVVTPDDRVPILDNLINEVDAIKKDVADGKYNGEKGPKGDPGSIKTIPVTEFPTENIDESAIYIVPSDAPDDKNKYKEFIYVNGDWEPFGNGGASIDLTGYATEEYVDNVFDNVPSVPLYTIQTDFGVHISNNTIRQMNNEFIATLDKILKDVCSKEYRSFMLHLFVGDSNDLSILFDNTDSDLSAKPKRLNLFGTDINGRNSDSSFTIFGTYQLLIDISWNETIPTITNSYFYCNQYKLLSTTNTASFTPTKDYHPATKKYVDDMIATLRAELQGGE